VAAENFKVKKGLEVGTGITANSDGINVTGIITATQYRGDGSGLTGVVASGTGVVVKDEGSAVGTAGTFNFVGDGVTATLSAGTATVTINSGGLNDVVGDTTPQLGGNLDLNSKFVTGSGGINITGVVTATTLKGNGDFVDIDVDGQTEIDDLNVAGVSTFSGDIIIGVGATVGIGTTVFFGDDVKLKFGSADGLEIYHSQNLEGTNDSYIDSSARNLYIRLNTETDNGGNIALQAKKDEHGILIEDDGPVKLYFDGNQKLTTTINGIEVPDLNVTGVGTIGRMDTSGVTLGTNSTTFAAKFADNAVANFGTDNDLKISHDDTHARITNTKGNIVVSGIISAISDVKVGSAITMDPTSGIITATSFSGSAAGLTSIPSAQLSGALPSLDGSALTGVTASGTGIVIQHDGSNVGTAGTINFSTNLDVSAISAGIVTVTASGGGGGNASTFTVTANNLLNETVYPIFVDGATGSQGAESDTNLSYNPSSNILTAGTFSGDLTGTVNTAAQTNITSLGTLGSLTVSGNITANGNVVGDDSTNISGIASITATSFHGSGIGLTSLSAAQLSGALPAISGTNLTSLDADNLGIGTIPNGRFPATLPAASGANLTALNASQISSGTLPIARVADNAVTFAKMQDVGTGVIIGRNDSGSGDMETLSASDVRTLLNVADGATAGITTASSNIQATWSIGGGSGSGYQFTGPGQDGSEGNPNIYLVRGQRYRFINTTGSSHPFAFRNEANNGAYTDGITGSQNGTQEFNVQHDAPAALKYRCTIHTGSMLGNIYIIGGITVQEEGTSLSTTATTLNFVGSGVTASGTGVVKTISISGGGGSSSVSIASQGDNRLITATGTSDALNAEQNLTFDGTKLTIGNSNISSGTHTFTASAGSAESISTTAIGDATTIEYTIFLVNGTNIQSQKVLIMDNGSTAYIEEYAVMSNPNLIGTFSADVNSGNVRLLLTPQTGISGTTTVKFTKMIIQ